MFDYTDVPRLVPARMLNEFTYCPRLFYLEWVQGQFEDNYYTVDGRYQHRQVDKETDQQSITLSSDKLGLIAKIDLLESDTDIVVPVETKRGSPPDNPEQSWLPDRIQLCVQAVLLREAGYTCTTGQIYYSESRKRVPVKISDSLITLTFSKLDQLREVIQQEEIPPPLVNSPKCPNCSLIGICMPDEINALSSQEGFKPRSILPRHNSASPLYVTEQGSTLGIQAGRIQIAQRNKPIESLRLLDVSQVNVYGGVQVSSQLLRQLFANEIPICWFSYNGWFQGIAHGLPSKNVDLRRKQVALSYHTDIEAARAMIIGKIKNCRTLLRRHSQAKTEIDTLRKMMTQVREATTAESLLGYEGAAARTYFQAFATILQHRSPEFDFKKRNRRPPTDPVNCLLSYLYALLTKELTATALAVGFDPYIGVYHRPRFGRPALALDLAEEFRPLIADSTVVTMINKREIRDSQFVIHPTGVALTDSGRRAVLKAFERRMETTVTHPTFGYQITYRRTLEVQARLLAAYMLGETAEYIAFETR